MVSGQNGGGKEGKKRVGVGSKQDTHQGWVRGGGKAQKREG